MTPVKNFIFQQSVSFCQGGPYKKNIICHIARHAIWASYYLKQSTGGIILAVIQIIPSVMLICPIINIITHLALSLIFTTDPTDLCQQAMNTNCLSIATWLMLRYHIDITIKNSREESIFDLFANQAAIDKECSDRDIALCAAIAATNPSAIFSLQGSQIGFEIMLDRAIALNKPVLIEMLARNLPDDMARTFCENAMENNNPFLASYLMLYHNAVHSTKTNSRGESIFDLFACQTIKNNEFTREEYIICKKILIINPNIQLQVKGSILGWTSMLYTSKIFDSKLNNNLATDIVNHILDKSAIYNILPCLTFIKNTLSSGELHIEMNSSREVYFYL